MNRQAAETALQKSSLFAGTETGDIADVLEIAEEMSFKEGEAIFEEGDEADGMYIVVDGEAQVDVGGRFHRFKEGDFFGEMAIVARDKRLATVRAVEPVTALRIPRESFQSFLLQHPRIAVKMLNALVLRLREVQQRIDAWIAS